MPLEVVEDELDNDVSLISFSYERSRIDYCDKGHPLFEKKGFTLFNTSLVFQNNGSQRLKQFYVGYEYYTGFYFCPYRANPWLLIETDLAPGERDTFNWPILGISCMSRGHTVGCLFAHVPNGEVDANFSDNYVCSINILSASGQRNHCDVELFPNPAQNNIGFIGCNQMEQAFIFNLTGAVVKSIYPLSNDISVGDLPEGMYFLQLRSSSGKALTKKFMINRN